MVMGPCDIYVVTEFDIIDSCRRDVDVGDTKLAGVVVSRSRPRSSSDWSDSWEILDVDDDDDVRSESS